MKFLRSKNTIQVDDEILVAEYRQSGDNKILGELFKRYVHLVFGVSMQYLKNDAEAQDMTMFVFEKLMSDLKNHQVNNFKSWLYMVTKNQCLMHLRKGKNINFVEFDPGRNSDDEDTDMDFAAEEHLDDAQVKEIHLDLLEKGLKELNAEQKTCVELFYLQNKSYVEIAEITGYELSKVKSYIQNGKRNLKIFMNKNNAG